MPISKVNAMDEEENFVIVIDPGHGGNDPGAINYGLGLREAEINYKISKYAKEELEKYEGVKVYLTRYDNCPTIFERGEIAKKYNADLVLSMHINSGNKNRRGAEVWVTQDNTKIEYYQKSKIVGEKVLNNLSKLGIKNRGVSTRTGKSEEIGGTVFEAFDEKDSKIQVVIINTVLGFLSSINSAKASSNFSLQPKVTSCPSNGSFTNN